MYQYQYDKELLEDEKAKFRTLEYQFKEEIKNKRPIYNLLASISPFYLGFLFSLFGFNSYIPLGVHPVFTMIAWFVLGCLISYIIISNYNKKLIMFQRKTKLEIINSRKT